MIEPWQSASVSAYREWAARAAREIETRGKRILFVGGTPLYLKALLRGLFQGPGADPDLRLRLERDATEHGDAALHRRLAAVDPSDRSPPPSPRPAQSRPRPRGDRAYRPPDQRASGRARSARSAYRARPRTGTSPREPARTHQSTRASSFSTPGLVEEVSGLAIGRSTRFATWPRRRLDTGK